MSTIYTFNGKVLKNSETDKWLTKKEAPAGFVMNGSNATYTLSGNVYFVSWQGPSYPEAYNGNGKQYILVNNNAEAPNAYNLMYGNGTPGEGPTAIIGSSMAVLGTSTGELLNNPAVLGSYGTYFIWPSPVSGATLEQLQAYIANVSITIVDP